ncbi:hypothetical protein X777_01644 [Ooceraea biroi]|uniref:Uncharacterized protein n=1 Tax=Ooceraea biroi TaxID=2015173 RepID=A0A026WM44_OOCBI|nr:hypothetical protein X777_01644 [Ooceraea biroi]
MRSELSETGSRVKAARAFPRYFGPARWVIGSNLWLHPWWRECRGTGSHIHLYTRSQCKLQPLLPPPPPPSLVIRCTAIFRKRATAPKRGVKRRRRESKREREVEKKREKKRERERAREEKKREEQGGSRWLVRV